MKSGGQETEFPVVELSERLLTLMKAKYGKSVPVVVLLKLVQGPCRDNWCQPIRKLKVFFMTGNDPPQGTVTVEVSSGVRVYIDKRIYSSAQKNRDRINLDSGPFGRIRISGLTPNY
ncbi:MAG: hypothetical protein KIY10_05015 [Thermoplasmata archaeon]|jgi:hypothetical protein|nr:hypothetical protein [Candidatus Sysuiplasma jiujiangense]MBX8641917.1 hypothetical protein [Candidatus Sysuiplasma jiujiangense]